MTVITAFEREWFGEPVGNGTRVIGGLAALVGVVGHLALAAAALTFILTVAAVAL